MSTQSCDPTHYYPAYINPHPAVTMEQFRLIQQAWKLVKDGQFAAFKGQTLIADPLGFWGLQFYDTLFALNPALKPLFKNTFTQSHMLTEMVDAALGLLPGVLDHALGDRENSHRPATHPYPRGLGSTARFLQREGGALWHGRSGGRHDIGAYPWE